MVTKLLRKAVTAKRASSSKQKKIFTTSFFGWFVCTLGAMYYCYEFFLRISPSVMLPNIMKAYNLTAVEVGSLSAFYYHAYVPMQIIVGLLMDRYNPRRLLTLACLCCAVGIYLFASGDSLALAKLGRFLVGLGSAFAFVGALKLATIWLPPNRFALISGIILCLGMVGAMFGDIFLRVMVDQAGWKTTLYISGLFGVFLAFILWLVIRDENPNNVIHQKHLLTFNNLFKALWKAVKNPQIWLNGLVGCLLYISLSAFAELWSIPYLKTAHILSNTQAASANSMIFLGWAFGGPLWGWLSDHIGRRCLPIMLSSILAFFLVCVLLYANSIPLKFIYLLLFLFGLTSSVQILVFSICREVSSLKIAGTAIALTNMIVMVGGNVFQPVIGKILDLHWRGHMFEGIRHYSASDYKLALSVLPISILLAIIVTFFIKETYCKVFHE